MARKFYIAFGKILPFSSIVHLKYEPDLLCQVNNSAGETLKKKEMYLFFAQLLIKNSFPLRLIINFYLYNNHLSHIG